MPSAPSPHWPGTAYLALPPPLLLPSPCTMMLRGYQLNYVVVVVVVVVVAVVVIVVVVAVSPFKI